jgi:hypothetical protein
MRAALKILGMVAALVAMGGVALAQGSVQQAGPVVPYHPPAFYSNGVIGDGGNSTNPFLSATALYNGANCPLSVSSQTGPGVSTSTLAQLSICQTSTVTTFKVRGLNGQATPSVQFDIGGTIYPFPGSGSGGGVVGPVSSVSGNLACWNGTTGALLSDCGIASTIAANTLVGNPTGSAAPFSALVVPNCNSSTSALNWTSGSGFSCRSIAGGGGVSSVATGAGLTGGPCTTTCTISVTSTDNPQTGTTYTVQAADAGGLVTLSNASSIAVTVPTPSGSFGAGFSTTLCDIGAGTATLTPTGATIGGAATYILTQGQCVSPVSDGSNYQAVPSIGTIYGLRIGASQVMLCSSAAPTITSAGTSPSVADNNGSCSFTVNVGTGGSASAVVLGLPTAAHGWTCNASDVTTQSTSVFLQKQTASSTTAATITNYNTSGSATAFVASDLLRVSCMAD